MQGASASWGCVPVPPTLGPRSQAPGSGVAGLSATNAPTLRYTHAHASLPRRFSPGGSDLTLKPALALFPLRPSGRETSPRGARVPQPSVSWVCLSPSWVRREAWARHAPWLQGPSAAGRGARPARPRRLHGPDGGESVCPLPLPRCVPPSTLGPGLRPGAVATPFLARHFLFSPPRLPGPNRTPQSWSPTKPSPFLPRARSPVHSVPGTSLVENC